jgi:hypothetical protein
MRWKMTLNGKNSRWHIDEEKTSELENIAVETTQHKTQEITSIYVSIYLYLHMNIASGIFGATSSVQTWSLSGLKP